LRGEIDRLNETIYANVNNGVYRCGFAKSQSAYESAYDALFATLDELDARLSRQRYLLGRTITEADWRLFPTLVRFDVAYFSLFRCNKQRIADYPNLANYMRELYQLPGIARLGVLTTPAPKAIWGKGKHAKFHLARIDAIEREVKHDVIAFLTHLDEIVGPQARLVHQGMTSSDALDTCLNVQHVRAAD